MSGVYFIIFLIAVVISVVVGNAIFTFKEGMEITIHVFLVGFVAYQIYVYVYFKGKEFKDIKHGIEKYTKNCNELNDHIADLKHTHLNFSSYDYGDGHLYDFGSYRFKRQEWAKNKKNNKVHHCSSSVCKNTIDQPFKYLCKYFDISVSEKTLSTLEAALNNFSAAEQGKLLLKSERDRILGCVREPVPLLLFYISKKRLTRELGFEPIDLNELSFPVYTFQYVSAGGNSAYKFDIILNMQNLEKFISYLGGLIKFKKSVAGQRTLMTRSVREKIKRRDNYTCQHCGLSVADEKNLLLEIDHIMPLSKGGVTSENNLQTLCWRCNRSKGAKIA